MPAIHAAAVQLLAERGPREVTVREIAERAGVNHALVHRHFGSKQALITSAIRTESAAVAAAAARPGAEVADVVHALAEHPAYFRMLARTVLDEPDMLAERLPLASALMEMLDSVGESAARRRGAVTAGSLILGWLVFGPHLATALDEPDEAGIERAVAKAVRAIVERPR